MHLILYLGNVNILQKNTIVMLLMNLINFSFCCFVRGHDYLEGSLFNIGTSLITSDLWLKKLQFFLSRCIPCWMRLYLGVKCWKQVLQKLWRPLKRYPSTLQLSVCVCVFCLHACGFIWAFFWFLYGIAWVVVVAFICHIS